MGKYGIIGKRNEWFKSYLNDRYQKTRVNECHSNVINVNYEVPQETVLGHLLFILYMRKLL